MLVRIRASLWKSHPLVEASRPERFEGQVVGANRGAGALTAPRACPVFPPVRGGEHSLGTLKDAAHARAASPASDATTLLRLRPPGTRALQATYCDRAFDLAPGLDPLFRGLTRAFLLSRFSRQARQAFKAAPSFLPPLRCVRKRSLGSPTRREDLRSTASGTRFAAMFQRCGSGMTIRRGDWVLPGFWPVH